MDHRSSILILYIKTIIIICFVLLQVKLTGQIMTKPLFMQIKSPKLEASSGTLIDSLRHLYLIQTSRNDSVDISFMISVPKEMLSEQWAISLTPTIQSTHLDGVLKEIVVRGWKFAEAQEEDYQQYNEFVNSIIDSSLYKQLYIDQKRLEEEIEHRHDQYWQYYYDEWERQVQYEIWKSKQDGNIKTFSLSDRSAYRDQLYEQYLLRIKNQSSRYLRANMDTTGLYQKYMNEFETHDSKMPRFFVENKMHFKKVPKKYKDIYESGRTLQDITNSMYELLEKRDSTLMSLIPILDYKKIIENEKRTMLQDDIFKDLIQLPKSENALIDTVLYDVANDYFYQYTYTYPISGRLNDTISVKLSSKILATDRSGFSSSSEDILTFIIENNSSNNDQSEASILEDEKSTIPLKQDQELEDLSNKLKKLTEPKENKKTYSDSSSNSMHKTGSRITILKEDSDQIE